MTDEWERRERMFEWSLIRQWAFAAVLGTMGIVVELLAWWVS